VSAIITFVHIVTCFILIIAVLLQSGKAADLAGAFGGGGSQTAFGPRGTASLLSKITTICAVLFMVTSLGLWMLSAEGTKSVVSGEQPLKKEAAAETTPTKKETQTPAASTQKEEGASAQEVKTKEHKTEAPKSETPPKKDLN
jgi:preprotein translocase subunit SecG